MLWATEKYKNTALSFKIKDVLFKEKSNYQMVEIIETIDWGRILMLDGLMMITEKDEFFYHESIVHLPMALKPSAQNALIIGGGDGGTLRELSKYSNLKKLQIVEIDELVIEASRQYLPFVGCGFDDPRVEITVQDAGEYIKKTENIFDLIIADSSDPEGFAAVLIEENFYEMIKKSLKPDGLYIAQSGSPLSQPEELKTTWRNLNAIFPYTEIAWSLTPTYPGAWWSFVIASNSPIDKTLLANNKFQPENCRLWKPALAEAMLSQPNYIQNLLGLN